MPEAKTAKVTRELRAAVQGLTKGEEKILKEYLDLREAFSERCSDALLPHRLQHRNLPQSKTP